MHNYQTEFTFDELIEELKKELEYRAIVYKKKLGEYDKKEKFYKMKRTEFGHYYLKMKDALLIIETSMSGKEIAEKSNKTLGLKYSLPEILKELQREMEMRAYHYPKWKKSVEETKVAIGKIREVYGIINVLHRFRCAENNLIQLSILEK